MRKARAVDEALGQAGFAQTGVVRPEAEPLVIARDGNDSSIAEHLGDAEIVDDAVIVKFTALGRMDIVCFGDWRSRNFVLPVNDGGTDAKRAPG